MRYSPPGKQVLLAASSHDDPVEVRVTDRGLGIPPTDRDRVFEAFQRLDDRDNHTGVGLGLTLARGLTEAMNGTLVPEETPGVFTMILTLPCRRAAAMPEAAGAVTEDQATHPGIRDRIDAVRAASRREQAPRPASWLPTANPRSCAATRINFRARLVPGLFLHATAVAPCLTR